MLGILRTVLFAPEDLALVKGDPGERRRFLDELLTARAPRCAGVRSDYDRVLKQRNALLEVRSRPAPARTGGGRGDLRHAGRLGRSTSPSRRGAARATARPGRRAPAAGREGVRRNSPPARAPRSGVPQPLLGQADADARRADATRPQLVELGCALHCCAPAATSSSAASRLVGPHRDDLLLRLGDLPAKGYASHGESWSYALALRLAVLRPAARRRRRAGADPRRRLRRARHAAARAAWPSWSPRAEQVLVTAAVPDDVPHELAGARFEVTEGSVGT